MQSTVFSPIQLQNTAGGPFLLKSLARDLSQEWSTSRGLLNHEDESVPPTPQLQGTVCIPPDHRAQAEAPSNLEALSEVPSGPCVQPAAWPSGHDAQAQTSYNQEQL